MTSDDMQITISETGNEIVNPGEVAERALRRKIPVTFSISPRQEVALARAAALLSYPKSEMYRAAIDYLIERLHVKFPEEPMFLPPTP